MNIFAQYQELASVQWLRRTHRVFRMCPYFRDSNCIHDLRSGAITRTTAAQQALIGLAEATIFVQSSNIVLHVQLMTNVLYLSVVHSCHSLKRLLLNYNYSFCFLIFWITIRTRKWLFICTRTVEIKICVWKCTFTNIDQNRNPLPNVQYIATHYRYFVLWYQEWLNIIIF